MAQSNQLPIDATMDSVTGGNLSNPYGRDNAAERVEDYSNGNSWAENRERMEEADIGNNINCNVRPRIDHYGRMLKPKKNSGSEDSVMGWKIFKTYMDLMAINDLQDFNTIAREALKILLE
jgi:hypothetical protein